MLFWCGGGDEFLEGRILAQWLKHWIRAEQSRSKRRVCGQGRPYGIESSLLKVEMERSGGAVVPPV
jgi:hypothetical protein